MSRLPRVTGSEVISALKRAGFREVRVRGSHHFMKHNDGRTTVVPMHSGEVLGPGLLSRILHDCDFSSEEFAELL